MSRMSGLIAAAAMIALAGCATAPGRVARAEASIEAIARDAVDRGFAPGVVVLVKEGDAAPFAYAYGARDIEDGDPLQMDDLFRIYSMTKPVTVAAALILVDDGVLSLDDPVEKFIPSFGAARVYAGGDTIEAMRTEPLQRPLTIRDLMRHTAGMTYKSADPHPVRRLYVLRGIDTGSGADIPPQDGSPPVSSSAELADRIAAIPLLDQPGARFSYGNAIDVLGRIVEVASGQRLGEFMRMRIFAPLGMNDTTFRIEVTDAPRMTAAYSAPRTTTPSGGILDAATLEELGSGALRLADPSTASVFSRPRPMDYGGAGLVSTPGDYMRFARMLLDGGALGEVRILSRSAVKEMTSEQLSPETLAASDALTREGVTFGLGVSITNNRALSKSGAPEGTYFWSGAASTLFWVDPENKIAGVIMTQVFDGEFRTFQLEMMKAIYRQELRPAR